jgi:hypothetical protein
MTPAYPVLAPVLALATERRARVESARAMQGQVSTSMALARRMGQAWAAQQV